MATKKVTDVMGLRAQITATRAALAELAQEPLPLAEAEAAMDAFLERLGAGYTPPLTTVFAHDPQPALAAAELLLGHPADGHAPWVRWAAVLREPLRALWHERLQAAYASDPALAAPVSAADRASRCAKLQHQLAALELAEERLITEGELHGEVIDRRADAKPAIVFSEELLRLEEGLDLPRPG